MRTLAHRRRAQSAAAMLGGALALAGCASNAPAPQPTAAAAAAHAVTFSITGHGSATVTWPGGAATHATLPWTANSQIPLGADGINLTVQLDAHGGQATCAISVDGRRLVSSLAQGAYSRATCHTPGSAQGDD